MTGWVLACVSFAAGFAGYWWLRLRVRVRALETANARFRAIQVAALTRHAEVRARGLRVCTECGMPYPCATRLDLTGQPVPPAPDRAPEPRIAGAT